jgi:hypothetical protein
MKLAAIPLFASAMACTAACTEKEKIRPVSPPEATSAKPAAVVSAPPVEKKPEPPPPEEEKDERKDPRSCSFEVPEQSCVPGPEGVDWACRSDCASDCEKCSKACAGKPTACVDDCLVKRDRCRGACVKTVQAYLEERRTNYGCKVKQPAAAICKSAVECIEKCGDKNYDACRAACKATRAAGCNAKFLSFVDTGTCYPFEDGI